MWGIQLGNVSDYSWTYLSGASTVSSSLYLDNITQTELNDYAFNNDIPTVTVSNTATNTWNEFKFGYTSWNEDGTPF
jgi:hypothetical protein